MRIVCVAALLAAFWTSRVTGIQASEDQTFAVNVHLSFDRSIVFRLVKSLEDETERIWRPYGVRLEWKDEPEAAAKLFPVEAIVERQIEGPQLRDRAAVLGHAFVRLDAPASQPIRVSFDATEHLLALRTTWTSFGWSEHERELARALGRVLAHEIGHVLLAAPNHDPAGLMRAAFRANELGAPEDAPFRLSCDGVGRLQSRIRVLTGDDGFAADRAPCIPGRANAVTSPTP